MYAFWIKSFYTIAKHIDITIHIVFKITILDIPIWRLINYRNIEIIEINHKPTYYATSNSNKHNSRDNINNHPNITSKLKESPTESNTSIA